MAELTSLDRLQPVLLDRLSDDRPNEPTEPRERRVVSMKQMRASVLRDLSNLLNAHALYGCASLDAHPYAAASVVNYGLRDVTGRALSSLDVSAFARAIESAVVRFEPRIAPQTVRVTPLASAAGPRCTSVAFLVEGDLWAQPYPERLYFRTELDLESGQVRIMGDVSAVPEVEVR